MARHPRAKLAPAIAPGRFFLRPGAGAVLVCTLLLACSAMVRAAGESTAGATDWLMLVRTENADPAREVEFNRWYDDIDIPDVFTVAGYQRARRGRAPGAGPPVAGEGRYVALYDIRSADIESTIEGMNRLAREMPQKGRATPLLKVTERIYYAAMGEPLRGAAVADASLPTWLLLERFDLAPQARDWYEQRVVGPALATAGIARVARFRLYRVRMDQPIAVPAFLTVWEIRAVDATAAANLFAELQRQALAGGAGGVGYRASDANLFNQIRDELRPGG